MDVIVSSDNRLIKRINKLKQKKYREQYGEFFVEGFANVADTAEASPDSVRVIVLSESAYKQYGGHFSEFDVSVVSDGLFCKIAETGSPCGVLSVNAMPKPVFPEGRACIFLDRVRDPGNVGTILRTACAAGYDVVLNNCADVFSPKVTRSAMSAVLKCRMGFDIPPCELVSRGYELVVADMTGENVFDASKPTGKFCVVIGNEADGVCDEIMGVASRILKIPQKNIESLNASVAAGIMMYALMY